MRVNLAVWTVDVNQTNVSGERGRKFVTRFNIRNSFTWVVTGEQLQVAESQPKSLQKTLVGPLPTTEQWLFKLEGSKSD